MEKALTVGVLFLAAFAAFFFPILPANAQVISGTPGNDSIVVTPSTDCEGVESDGGDDTIIVEEAAEVNREVTASGSGAVDADATAIDAGTGDDTVENDGTVTANAATISSSEGEDSTASSKATGVDGGEGVDVVNGTGPIVATTNSSSSSAGASLSINGIVIGDGGTALNQASATSNAEATGIDAAEGPDSITNSSAIGAGAIATATTVDVGATVEVSSEGSVSGASLSDTSADALATAEGIEGGDASDTINNAGEINLFTNSQATAVGVSVTIAGSVEGDTGGDALTDASATATSAATGIDGDFQPAALPIFSEWGADIIVNTVALIADVNATATTVEVGASIAVSEYGTVSGAALNDSRATANAAATGIDGGGGNDIINNTDTGAIALSSDANATGVVVGLSVAGKVAYENEEDASATEGGVEGTALSDSSATANAEATGIDGGGGADDITNRAAVAADVGAGATSVSVSGGSAFDVGINVEATGDVTGAALSDAGATANAAATGIDGGEGDDSINNENTGAISLTSAADATSVAVGLNVAGKVSYASADGESGSEAQAGADGSTIEGTALSDSRATANAEAAGIDGGGGSDSITNRAVIAADVDSGATAVSLSGSAAFDVGINVAATGDVTGAALSDAGATANAAATGIDGGEDGGSIINETTGSIMLWSDADASSVAVGLNVAGKVSYAKGEESTEEPSATQEENASGGSVDGTALSDSSAMANADAIGISGGGGADDITNRAAMAADVGAGATSVSVSGSAAFDVGINVEATGDVTGAALSDAGATANAAATGIDGGEGDDSINNETTGTVTLKSDANATAWAVGLNVAGKVSYAKADESTEEPSATQEEDTGGGSVSGTALSDSSATANAEATGIDGGGGADDITNRAVLSADVDSGATAVSVTGSAAFDVGINVEASGDVTGAALSDAGATANAAATGIDGGEGGGSIVNETTGSIMLWSDADATSVAVGLNVAGKVSYAKGEEEEQPSATQEGDTSGDSVSGTALSDSSATANAAATGIDGGSGTDDITNKAAMAVDVNSTATAVSVSGSAAFDVGINVDATGDVDGMALSDASATAIAAATGIDGRGGDDTILNDTTGSIILASDADATGVAVGLNVSGKVAYKGDASGSIESAALSDTSVLTDAAATGIDGGEGFDSITNGAAIAASAGADATGVSVSLGAAVGVAYKGDAELDVSGATVSKASTRAKAETTGIDAGENDDTVNNTGPISVYSDSDATGVAAGVNFSAAIAIEGDVNANVEGAALNDSSVTATASATGIDGGEGNDTIINDDEGGNNTGKIFAAAESDAVAVAASLDIAGTLSFKGNTEADVGGSAVSDSNTTANADATGIRGDIGNDDIDNAGDIELLANSDATGVSAGLNVAAALTFEGAAQADVTGEAVSKADVTANAVATGIDGGDGNDTITNSGDITVMKGPDAIDASATGVAASLNITGNVAIKGVSMGSASGSAMSEAEVEANATATGIDGGKGDDTIENTGNIDLLPESDGLGVAASLNVTGNMIGEASGYAGTDSSVTATATAIGIDGGENNDIIINDGIITLMKQGEGQDEVDANSESYAASLSITGTMNGSTEGQALSKATSEATATGIGIDGGSGIDDITNRAKISGDVDSSATALSISANISVTGNGEATGAALSDASAMANAIAKGIDGGEDTDTIYNAGEIDMSSSSEAESTAVSVSLTASMKGVAEGNAMADGSAEATSLSAGIDGGTGDDIITALAQMIKTDAYSSADATSVTVSGGGTVGLTTGASVSDSGATGEAYSTGIDGGLGNDTITTASQIEATSKAKADADATTVAVQIGAGVVGGYGLANSSATAKASSTGIDGGDGVNIITNTGNIIAGANPLDSDPMALATAGSTIVSVGFAAGESANDGASDSFALAEANALGIGSGSGADTITNEGALFIAANPLDLQPLARADATSTTVSIGITAGVNNSSAASDSSTIARVAATGIDSGSENDTITNRGAIIVGTDPYASLAKMAYASASSTTVDVGITLGADLGATSAEASAIAEATSTGINSGTGDDFIDNTGSINAGSSSLATSSATVHEVKCSLGASVGDAQSGAAILSSATAVGIDSGAGSDEISTEGAMTVKASSQGSASAKTNTLNFLSVGANLQSAHANSSAIADATALGIAAGADNDTIQADGTLLVTAGADVSGTARSSVIQGLGLGVSVLESQSEAATAANSLAIGIDGGEGNDSIISDAAIALVSSSNAFTSAVSSSNSGFTLAGASFGESAANASTTVTADGTGIDGGEGFDEITSNEAISVSTTSTANVSATSSVGAVTFAGSAGGKALSDSSALVKASATGIDGGGADDTITSNDDVTAAAVSDGTVISSANANANVVFGSASTKTVSDSAAVGAAEAAGISGGEGNDTITSLGAVTSLAETDLHVIASSVSVSNATFGSAYASAASKASSEANAEAMGIIGGAGNDFITSEGPINSKATSTTTVHQTTVAIASATFGSANTLATSSATVSGRSAATGISGNEGVDTIISNGPITVESGNVVNTDVFTKSGAGPAKLDARTLAVVHAAGIDAGADDDGILSTDTILVKGVPHINSFTRNYGSNVQGRVGVDLTSDVKGIVGGRGNDTIINEGDVLVLAGSPETASTATGSSTAGSSTFTDATLIGKDPDVLVGKWIRVPADEGADLITRIEAFDPVTGEMTLRDPLEYDVTAGSAYTMLDSGNKTPDIAALNITVGGWVTVDASTTASVNATGIDGGDGYNDITNTGPVLVRARNAIQAGSVTIAGNINADMNTEAAAKAVGIAGADRNEQSTVFDDSEADMTTIIDKSLIGEDPNSIVGKTIRIDSGLSAGFETVIQAYDDRTGTLTLLDPIPEEGIAAGDKYTLLSEGTAVVTNFGEIDSEAGASIDASNWYISYWGDANVETIGRSQANSNGMLGGDMNDSLYNVGSIAASSTASVVSTDRVTADLGDNILQTLTFEAVSDSRGVSSGLGDDLIINRENALANIDAASIANVSGTTITYEHYLDFGQSLTVNFADARANSTAMGLDLGAGDNTAYNYGGIRIIADADAEATAISDYGFFKETNADADAVATASSSGFFAGSGVDQVSSSGILEVDASAAAISFAQGSAIGGDDQSTVTGDSDVDTYTFIDESLIPAEGETPLQLVGKWVRFLSGGNEGFYAQIVTFNPETGEVGLADSFPADLLTGDLYTFSDARDGTSAAIATATATGLDLHDGANIVENAGELLVTAYASSHSTASAYGGQASAEATSYADARGIRTGAGDDVVLNTGVIDVSATAEATGPIQNASATAIGIQTGDGNDSIINRGSILTYVEENGVPGTGVGIDSGAGNDQLFLIEDSSVEGDIYLGVGDDALTFANNATVNGNIMGDSGIDSLIIADENTFAISPPSDVEQVYLNYGTLEINDDYNLASDASSGLLQTRINYLRQYSGLLHVDGDTGLNGTIQVIASPYTYENGDTFNVVEADTITGTFETVTLPDPTPLLDFDLHYLEDPDIVQVEVTAESFTTVATNPTEMAIARYLDEVAPSSTGDLSHTIGTIQLMQDPDFGSLGPDSYNSSTIATCDVSREYVKTIQQRMRTLRSGLPLSHGMQAKSQDLLLAYNGPDESIARLVQPEVRARKRYGAWVQGFGQWGDLDSDSDFPGYDYDMAGVAAGFDYAFTENLLLGVSYDYTNSDVDLHQHAGDGNIDGNGVSIYGMYFPGNAYLEGVLSYAKQEYDNSRLVVIDTEQRIARSDHDANAYSAFVEGGYNFSVNRWFIGPFASLEYIYLDEDSFRETGAGEVSLEVDDRQTDYLFSELGLRISAVFDWDSLSLIPEAAIAWSHDYDIDDRDITASFVSTPGNSFTIEGQDIDDDGITVEAGLTILTINGWSTSLKYVGDFRDDYKANGIIGEVRFIF